MGLDFRWRDKDAPPLGPFERPSWSYSGFMTFRERLARDAELIGRDDSLDDFYCGAEMYPSQFTEPLVLLIDHADCEGDLSPDQCKRLAPRLKALIAEWNEPDDYDRMMGERLVAAMDECARDGRVLEFC
jgi:hypothetical protein